MPYSGTKEEQREKSRAWYAQSEHRRSRTTECNRAHRTVLREFVITYKREHPCVMCGEPDPACLDFHHVDNKVESIGNAVSRGWSVKRLTKEIDKCEVLCANCHRKLHANSRTKETGDIDE